jgi:hypothetical protein
MGQDLDRRAILTGALLLTPGLAHADALGDIFGSIFGKGGSTGVGGLLGGGFTNADADSALRQALTIGAGNVVTRLGAFDGYFADPKVHIPLPKSLQQVQSGLKAVGYSKPLDDLELKINRGAETAAPKAKTLFVNAIKAMTIQDAIGIVKGGDTAGTEFLKGKTLPSLTTAFTPPMNNALSSVGALKAADKVASETAKFGYRKDLRGELISYAVGSALSGMFLYLGEEEKAIRENPAKRTTAILKKVFGAV